MVVSRDRALISDRCPAGALTVAPLGVPRCKSRRLTKPNVRFTVMTWAELIRKLKDAGFVELRTGRWSHRQLVHPRTNRVITIAVDTKKEVGTGLARRILKDAGIL